MQVRYDYELEGTKLVRMIYRDRNGKSNDIIPLYDTSEAPIGIIHSYIDDDGNKISRRYWYAKNLQGDILALRDDTGADVVRYVYDAWGKVTVGRDNSGVDLADINPFRYRGYLYDYEFGLYYLQSRYYDPETCRFINPDDPEAIAYNNGDLICNLYTYCLNNPINNTDISGNLTAQLAARIILGIMIGIIVQLVSDIIDIMIARILGADEKRPVGSEYLASALSWALTCVSVNKKACRS